MTTVSIVMPTYNAAPHIGDATQSILSQSYRDFELIIVDDGSTDGTLDIIDSFDDKRITLINRSGSGITGALNRGLREASGKYIARQDGDDISHPDRLEKQVSFLKEHPKVALVGTASKIIDENGRLIDKRHVLRQPTIDDLVQKNRFIHGSVMMRRDAVESVGGYDETFKYTEDYDLWLRIAEKHPVRNIDEFLYNLRLLNTSIYGSELFEVKLWELFARKRFKNDLDKEITSEIADIGDVSKLYSTLDESEKAELHRAVGQELLRYHEFTEARKHLHESKSLKWQIQTELLTSLSYLPPTVEDLIERMYRTGLNIKIKIRNNLYCTLSD